jgi:hypothetical protein
VSLALLEPTLQTDGARSLFAAAAANAAAMASNAHQDNGAGAGGAAGACTVSVADAAAPGGASLQVTCDVVFTCTPIIVPRTLTVIVQDWPAAITFDVLENVSVPGLIEKIPPPVASVLHVPPVCVMRSMPTGMVSLN